MTQAGGCSCALIPISVAPVSCSAPAAQGASPPPCGEGLGVGGTTLAGAAFDGATAMTTPQTPRRAAYGRLRRGNVGERLIAKGARHDGDIRAQALEWRGRVEIAADRIEDRHRQFSVVCSDACKLHAIWSPGQGWCSWTTRPSAGRSAAWRSGVATSRARRGAVCPPGAVPAPPPESIFGKMKRGSWG